MLWLVCSGYLTSVAPPVLMSAPLPADVVTVQLIQELSPGSGMIELSAADVQALISAFGKTPVTESDIINHHAVW